MIDRSLAITGVGGDVGGLLLKRFCDDSGTGEMESADDFFFMTSSLFFGSMLRISLTVSRKFALSFIAVVSSLTCIFSFSFSSSLKMKLVRMNNIQQQH